MYDKCPICDRYLIPGPSIDDHHLIPRAKLKNNNTVKIHTICHQKIHSVFTETELALEFYTVDLLLSHQEIQKFVKWVKNKPPEYHDSSKFHNRRKKR